MDISLNGFFINFRTPFSEAHDLIQVFTGACDGILKHNSPFDFHSAGLQRKGHPDIWHMDIALAYCTDETTPVFINGEDIGGNHSFPYGVLVYAPEHGKGYEDIGSLWKDDKGLSWTLVRVDDKEHLMFVSENLTPSGLEFEFAKDVTGILHYVSDGVHKEDICAETQQGGIQLARSNRYIRREMYYYKDGVRYPVTGYHTQCDKADIIEEYEIINPATMADALRAARPKGGYTSPQDLAVGTPMFLYRTIFHILDDGTILVDFDHETLQEVCFNGYLAIMYQEKCDVYGAGIWRMIPKTLPIKDKEGICYDFSKPYNTSQKDFPQNHYVMREEWENPDLPPDRQIDFIRMPGGGAFTEGDSLAGFAGGFLPLFDGQPAVRAANIREAVQLVGSRKTYPAFIGTIPYQGLQNTKGFTGVRGIGYKKYFPPVSRNYSVYTVDYNDITYIYVDFWAEDQMDYCLKKENTLSLTEHGGDLTWQQDGEVLHVKGSHGYAVFTTK